MPCARALSANGAAPAALERGIQNETIMSPVSPVEAGELFIGLAGETALLVAVSGGPDSVALLALLADWGRAAGRPTLHAATVDHGLRPRLGRGGGCRRVAL